MPMIEVAIDDGVATLTLSRPERKNALNGAMQQECCDALDALRRDSNVRALVLTGAGEDFCAGGDVSSMQGGIEAPAMRARMLENHRMVSMLQDFDRPVIAAVDGVAYGAGFSLALLADIVIASARARFCFAFSRIGLVPDLGAAWTLPRVVGMQKARELIYSAREIDAAEAQALGIVLEVQPQEALLPRAREFARAMAAMSPDGFAMTKRLLAQSFERDLPSLLDAEASAQAVAMSSGYVREAAARFARKEPPLFRWPKARD